MLALATIYDGGSRGDAARVGGVTLQSVRDWMVRFNAEGPPGLIDRKAPGAAPKLDAAQKRAQKRAEKCALAEIVGKGPIPAVHGVVCWRLIDLVQWVCEVFRVSVSPQTLSRELHALG